MHTRIFNNLQNIFNLMSDNSKLELIEAFDVEINSTMLGLYVGKLLVIFYRYVSEVERLKIINFFLGSVVRTVLALHDLVKNRLDPRFRRHAAMLKRQLAEISKNNEELEDSKPAN